MNRKSFEQKGSGRPKKTSQSNQPCAGLSVNQQFFVGLFTRKDVALQLDTCVHTVARYTKRGLLPAIVFGKRLIRYKREDVEKFIRSATHGNGGPR